jgi:hypothetical protein
VLPSDDLLHGRIWSPVSIQQSALHATSADAIEAEWAYKDLQTLEHDFPLDCTLDTHIPVRKLGRVAALTKGLRHHGLNLVRTVADLNPVSQLLGDRESSEHGVNIFSRDEVCLWNAGYPRTSKYSRA